MDIGFFELLTPVTYWLLIAMWSFILYFYARRLRADWHQGSLMLLLFTILTIDAFRTLFESLYFGAWYTARVGLLPMAIHDYLVQPQMVIIPKLLNVFAAGLIITILFRFWLPREGEEISSLETSVRRRTLELSETVEKLESEVRHRKQMEEAITARELEFRTLAENQPDNIARYDSAGRLRYMNPSLVAFLGRPPEELLGKTPMEAYPGGEMKEYQERLDQVLADGREATLDVNLPDTGEGPAYHNIRFVAERDESGAVTGALAMCRDLSPWRRAMDEVQKREAYIRRLIDASPLAEAVASGPEQKVLLINRKFTELFGYTIDEMPDVAHWWPLAYPDLEYRRKIAGEWAERVDRAIATRGEIQPMVALVTCKDGTRRHIEFRFSSIGDQHLVIFVDLTERIRMEEALVARELEFRTLAENLPDNIARYDTACRITYFNPNLLATMGVTAEEVIGKTPMERNPDGAFNVYQEKIEQVLRSGEEVNCDLVLPDSRKGERFHNIRFVAERDQNGAITGVLSIGRDITERKRADEERTANLRFFERMDRINQAIQSAADLEGMMGNVLDAVLAIFDCDRAYLMYPCDPGAKFWTSPMERTRPEYPGVLALGVEMPMDQEVADGLRMLLNAGAPVRFGPGNPNHLPHAVAKRFGIQGLMAMALHPKVGTPWQFGIHQCSRSRIWTSEEERLFQEIGRRLGDALSTLLVDRDLRQSERRFITLVNQAADAFFVHDMEGHFLDVNRTACESLGYTREELLAMNVAEVDAEFVSHAHVKNFWSKLTPDHPVTLEGMHKRKNGTTFPVEVRLCLSQLDDRWVTLALARDITERKAAGEALSRMNEVLERRVQERTAELEKKNEELERMNQLFVGRELRMVELKKRLKKLETNAA
ncbi:MAG: PAS domain S-box protein [Desulfurivibrionaceae bacterium]